ncbi:formyl-CoA transferase [Thermosulfidibacter takaii ABI70S6]|uniref:Formyl-CoA transferase n=1 Tax=Thermosulfidibacter takaii (strain DSM 17441 / JCM 13301 / NBRC 103674 / ABI70S6) TaxID=1298851 RepID=A0A0S3QSC6_THET7|nr:CoA transferase [Thermosulfidibacter takaii]BAT71207.1 formyl-CoA transferase [Thermosulfidibacter takaii ABI70S6]
MDGGFAYQDLIKEIFSPEKLFEKPEVLKGVRILDVTAVVLGPAAVDYLAEFGAEVIKFEPAHGDQMRFVTPFAYFWKNMSPGLWEQQHNRYWVGMHLGHPKAKELFLKFVEKADVVVDNLTPGRLAQWGVDYSVLREINPKIIQLHVSGFGSWGPWTGRTSYDAIAQSMGGLAYITGFEDRGPIKSGVWIADWINGLMCAVAIVAALNYREKTGEGQFIDMQQVENVIRMLDWTWLYVYLTGKNRPRAGNRDLAICPSDLFDCADGWVAITAFTDEEFKGLCKAMNRMDLYEKYKDPLERLKDEDARALLKEIAEWAKDKSSECIIKLADEYGFAATRVLEVDDVYHGEHFNERKAIQEYEDEVYGFFKEQAYPPRMSQTPSRVKWGARPVGFDNEYVFVNILGLPLEEVRKLEEEGVIFKWNPEIPSTCPPPDWDGISGIKYP